MGDKMNLPKTAEEFINDYKIKDRFEVYTNGSDLIPVFRVEQMIEIYFKATINVTAAVQPPRGEGEQMTDKQTIKELSRFIEILQEEESIYFNSDEIIKLCVVLRNAREVIERQKNYKTAGKTTQKGCVRCIHGKAFYCYDSKRIYVGADGSVTVYVNGEYIDIPANFKHCPWCGAPLNVLKGGEK